MSITDMEPVRTDVHRTAAPVFSHLALVLVSPWYNRTAWLGVKHQVTGLLVLVLCYAYIQCDFLLTSGLQYKPIILSARISTDYCS